MANEGVFDFKRADLDRIDDISYKIKIGETIDADEAQLYADWQAAIARDEQRRENSVAENREKIAEIRADNTARAADALEKLAALASKAVNARVKK